MSVEHASTRIVDAYARGGEELAADEVWALEAHLETCGACRERLSAAVTSEAPALASLVGTVWSALEPHLATTVPVPPRRRWSAALTAWLTPVMVPWLATAVSVTLIALLLEVTGVRPGLGNGPLVLLFAPLLPVCGVAASWSRGLDPAYELTASAPRAGLPLVLRRTAAVLAVVIPPLLVGSWATGVSAGQWLLPALAFTSAALALGTVVGVTRACAALAVVWAAVVLAPTLATGRTTFALQPDGMPVWGLLLALGAGVVAVRKDAYSLLGTHR
ncbi:putative zinc finger protein [Streptomyces sp. Amel2xB2]|uniref:zf-HC2 domain-containing protein n=1 Tax=Streptomyces sp. Amel2xB2 TaxID=1305829 RepID=UPI000DB9FB0B|nr:zf-HC2 domain-containing protein [Streptomyces sp. Amel2xB2]RAJ69894.1 putative zinc finger protein [Streptomyces sp. Amel2xB2]